MAPLPVKHLLQGAVACCRLGRGQWASLSVQLGHSMAV